MIISIVKTQVQGFKNYLSTQAKIIDEPLLHWESQYHFQKNWDINSDEFLSMYQKSISNTQSRRYWQREQFTPKQSMEWFINLDAAFVKMMFNDLFNEAKSVSGRIDRFIFYCDEMLERVRDVHKDKINNHYHDIPFVYYYLALRYPDQYSVYDVNNFRKTLELMKAMNIPQVADPDRYFKSSRILDKFLKEETGIEDMIIKRLQTSLYISGETLLPVNYFCYYCAHLN
ncbi:MAG TPA: hypothetical protein VK590_15625 [Saprospiraceae bacterium]|nr:hypothetical protein [Saprospiraceae bacterium]